MEFPPEIIKLIKEYSMPITRPDWRTCCKFSYYKLKYGVHVKTRQREFILFFCPTNMYQYYNSKNKIFGFHRYWDTFRYDGE